MTLTQQRIRTGLQRFLPNVKLTKIVSAKFANKSTTFDLVSTTTAAISHWLEQLFFLNTVDLVLFVTGNLVLQRRLGSWFTRRPFLRRQRRGIHNHSLLAERDDANKIRRVTILVLRLIIVGPRRRLLTPGTPEMLISINSTVRLLAGRASFPGLLTTLNTHARLRPLVLRGPLLRPAVMTLPNSLQDSRGIRLMLLLLIS